MLRTRMLRGSICPVVSTMAIMVTWAGMAKLSNKLRGMLGAGFPGWICAVNSRCGRWAYGLVSDATRAPESGDCARSAAAVAMTTATTPTSERRRIVALLRKKVRSRNTGLTVRPQRGHRVDAGPRSSRTERGQRRNGGERHRDADQRHEIGRLHAIEQRRERAVRPQRDHSSDDHAGAGDREPSAEQHRPNG